MIRLASDVPQDRNVDKVLRSFTADPATQCRMEMAQAVQLRTELLFVKG